MAFVSHYQSFSFCLNRCFAVRVFFVHYQAPSSIYPAITCAGFAVPVVQSADDPEGVALKVGVLERKARR